MCKIFEIIVLYTCVQCNTHICRQGKTPISLKQLKHEERKMYWSPHKSKDPSTFVNTYSSEDALFNQWMFAITSANLSRPFAVLINSSLFKPVQGLILLTQESFFFQFLFFSNFTLYDHFRQTILLIPNYMSKVIFIVNL